MLWDTFGIPRRCLQETSGTARIPSGYLRDTSRILQETSRRPPGDLQDTPGPNGIPAGSWRSSWKPSPRSAALWVVIPQGTLSRSYRASGNGLLLLSLLNRDQKWLWLLLFGCFELTPTITTAFSVLAQRKQLESKTSTQEPYAGFVHRCLLERKTRKRYFPQPKEARKRT